MEAKLTQQLQGHDGSVEPVGNRRFWKYRARAQRVHWLPDGGYNWTQSIGNRAVEDAQIRTGHISQVGRGEL